MSNKPKLSDNPDALPLVEQAPPQEWWHAFGPADDVQVVGPTGYDGNWASGLGDVFSPAREYLGTWEHEPSAQELAEVTG